VVEPLPRRLKVKGLSPAAAAGAGRKKMVENKFKIKKFYIKGPGPVFYNFTDS
jgi:hypothetical protein